MKRVDLKTEKKDRHPWIYRKMCERPEEGGGVRDGDAVAVFDRRGRFIGRGLYNGRSQITLRMLDFAGGERKIDPPDAPLDFAFLRERIERAVRLRRDVLRLGDVTDAYRLVNSEGDDLSGLIVDLFGDCASVELMSLGFARARSQVEQALRAVLGGASPSPRPSPGGRGGKDALRAVVFRADEKVMQLEGFQLKAAAAVAGAEPVRATIEEHGIRFQVDLVHGHKTGFFLDQRDNRRAFAEHVAGKRVLDVCCYTGGFSLYAKVKGGARSVLGVDLDERAVAVASENAALNRLRPGSDPRAEVRFQHANAFHFLRAERAAEELFDAIVLDPPKLAASRAALDRAIRDYVDLNRLAMRNLARPSGLLLTCSCSGVVSQELFLEILARAAAEADRTLRVLRLTGPGADHPTVADFPEGLYLKVVLAEVRSR